MPAEAERESISAKAGILPYLNSNSINGRKCMKIKLMMLGILIAIAGISYAEEAPAVEAAQPVEVGNKICPISGEEVGKMGEGAKVEYKGKIYTLCCGMCEKEFNSDPEKFVSKVEKQMAATQ